MIIPTIRCLFYVFINHTLNALNKSYRRICDYFPLMQHIWSSKYINQNTIVWSYHTLHPEYHQKYTNQLESRSVVNRPMKLIIWKLVKKWKENIWVERMNAVFVRLKKWKLITITYLSAYPIWFFHIKQPLSCNLGSQDHLLQLHGWFEQWQCTGMGRDWDVRDSVFLTETHGRSDRPIHLTINAQTKVNETKLLLRIT